VNILRAALELNDTRMEQAYGLVHSTIVRSAQGTDGIQDDNSFSQHSTDGMG